MSPDPPTPDEIRSRTFGQTLRGYDRDEVGAFLAQIAAELESAASRIGELETRAGLDRTAAASEEIDAELAAVREDVGRVLQTAREAAEGMRSRAADDAARWRAEADADARRTRDEAEQQAFDARRSAWEAGAELLDSALRHAQEMVATAHKDVLLIRAEAEREAVRLTSEARRSAEEQVGGATTKADRILAEARLEAEEVVEAAHRSADAAQERTLALERRRTELLEELDNVRRAIGGVESDLDGRRGGRAGGPPADPRSAAVDDGEDALDTADDARDTGAPDSGAADTAPPDTGGYDDPFEGDEADAGRPAAGGRSHGRDEPGRSGRDVKEWESAEGSVRIVPASRLQPPEPVDADALMAEVEAMRRDVPAARAPDRGPPPVSPPRRAAPTEPARDRSEADEAAPAPTAPGSDGASAGEPSPADDEPPGPPPVRLAEVQDAAGDRAVGSEPDAGPDAPAEDRATAARETEPAVAAPVEAPLEPEPEPGAQEIDDLFDRLRTVPDPQPEPDPVAAAEQPDPALTPVVDPPGEESAVRVAPTGPEDAGRDVAMAADPFEVRDRLLLPVQNRALRSVKRSLLDLQNRVLEDLRVEDESWGLDEAMLHRAFRSDLTALVEESYVTGFAGAAEVIGAGTTPAPSGSPDVGVEAAFVSDLRTGVVDAVERGRAGDGGARAASAAASRVFRAWRTDEAERRVRSGAFAAYHQGVAAGLAAAGCAHIGVRVAGRPCHLCAPLTEASWEPGRVPVADLPPRHAECACVVVPA